MTTSSRPVLQPLLSVVIPVWNRAGLVLKAAGSLLRQGETGLEVVIVDDGSTDSTPKVLTGVQDKRVQVVRTDHVGASHARNVGVEAASGEWVAFLDDDDVVEPGWLNSMGRAIAGADVGAAFVGMLEVDEEGVTTQIKPKPLGPLFHGVEGLFLAGCYAVPKETFGVVGGFDEELAFGEHTELGIRIAAALVQTGGALCSDERPLVRRFVRREKWYSSRAHLEARLAGSVHTMQKHWLLFGSDRQTLANYCAVAGVCAAKLGRTDEARRWFRSATRARPTVRALARIVAVELPFLARRLWATPE